MKRVVSIAWQVLAFAGLSAVVALMWASYPRVQPLGPTGAAWVQAVGSIIAIIVSAAFAVGVPIYLNHQRRVKYRRALVGLLEGICQDFKSHQFWVETGGQESTRYVPGAFLALADQLAAFPVHELDDPQSIKEVAEAAQHLRQMVDDMRPHLHKPRAVWDRLQAIQHNIWQRQVWANHRFGWGPSGANPTHPNRAFGTDPQLSTHFTWDEDGNPRHTG